MTITPRPLPIYSIDNIFKQALLLGASDIHIKPYSSPRVRVDGDIKTLDLSPLSPFIIDNIIKGIMDEQTMQVYSSNSEVDFAIEVKPLGRLRVNAYKSRGESSLALRIIPPSIQTIKELNMPTTVGDVALLSHGLCIIAGSTGSGKSTTLAAMIHHINNTKNSHIVTIEDPIEFIHVNQRSFISQREVYGDTKDFTTALRSVLRQDPDVIVIGEMRDVETARTALLAAETGHLVLTTLHTTHASDTISRIIDFFPAHEQQQIRTSLSYSLQAVFCQKLVPTYSHTRIPAVEVLLNRGRIPEAISHPDKSSDILSILETSKSYGMQSMEDSLLSLLKEEKISFDVATSFSRIPQDFTLRAKKPK